MRFQFLRTEIDHDENEFGEMRFLVHSWYRERRKGGAKGGKIICIPDSKGWETREEAELEAARIREERE